MNPGIHRRRPGKGYALVSTLLILALVAVIVISLLALQRRDSQRVRLQRDLTEARANALFALDTALSELQRYAGPDQAATAPTEILGDGTSPIANPKWTTVLPTTARARENQSLPAILVSGNEKYTITEETTQYPPGYLEPTTSLPPSDPDVIPLVSLEAQSEEELVVAPRIPILSPSTEQEHGHYAYWVGDEGVKAKVTLVDPYRKNADEIQKMQRFSTAQRLGIEAILPKFDPDEKRLPAITSLGEFRLLQEKSFELKERFHDFTTHSVGLMTDTRKGGFRKDLTLAFSNDTIFEREFGARRTGITPDAVIRSNDLYTLDSSRLPDFYLLPEIFETATNYPANAGFGKWVGGPNWGNLREYFLLHDRPPNEIPFLPHPRNGVKMRHYSFNPYKHGRRNDKRDFYHRNSPVSPVLSRAQMNVRLRTKEIPAGEDEDPKYQIDLEVQPVVGIWNPYNIAFTERKYRFDWEISIFVRLQIDGEEKRYDLYRLWRNNSRPWFALNTTTVDLQPGESRLFSVDSRQNLRQVVTLVPRWNEDGAFWVRLPEDPARPSGPPLIVESGKTIEVLEVGLVAAVENQRWSNALKELQKHNTFMAIKYGETVGTATSKVESSSIRMNNLWKADDQSGPQIVPEEGDAIPPFRPSQHTDEPKRLAAWAYTMRSSREDDLGHRNFVDSNVRAIVANSRWDGSVEDRGWRAVSWLADGANRALLPPGAEEPEADGLARYRGFGGNSISATGQTHLILFDVPREPLVSLGQLQHANVGRYNNEPSFPIGNSYHNIRIPPGETLVRDFAQHDTKGLYSSAGLDIFDLSYRLNEELWDSWFFSTVDPQNLATQIESWKDGEPLPVSRFLPNPLLDTDSDLFVTAEAENESYQALGAEFLIDGAFNVNSTSVAAWKTVLSSLRRMELPIYDPVTGELDSWTEGKLFFNRFSRPFSEGYESGQSSTYDNYWRGYRELTEEQIDHLATELVRQIKLRGPFRSLSDFVNRSLEDTDPSPLPEDDTRIAGPLQAALDRTPGINLDIDSSLASPNMEVPDSAEEYHDVPEAGTQGTGFPGFLLQGDILQAIGPTLTARSDTFRIRAYGDKVITARGQPEIKTTTARAWCEAIVQRVPDPVEPIDQDFSDLRNLIQAPEDLQAHYRDPNRPYFGRKFRVVSFRWLGKDDL